MAKKGWVALIFMMCLISVPVSAYNGWNARVPNGSVFGCDTCHSGGNDFICDFENAGNEWTTALANMDSDGDGYSNGVELQDLDGSWREGDPNPGNVSLVTNPGESSSHPQPTATPTTSNPETATPTVPGPTSTAVPGTTTPTYPPEISPTPTPTTSGQTCSSTKVTIQMPKNDFTAGDLCNTKAIVCNAEGQTLTGYPLIVALDVLGTYYFAPNFTIDFNTYLEQYPEFTQGETVVSVLGDFTWPENTGTVNGITWYAGLTNAEITEMVGDLGFFEFGWH